MGTKVLEYWDGPNGPYQVEVSDEKYDAIASDYAVTPEAVEAERLADDAEDVTVPRDPAAPSTPTPANVAALKYTTSTPSA